MIEYFGKINCLATFYRYIDFRHVFFNGKKICGSFCDCFWFGKNLPNEKEEQLALILVPYFKADGRAV